MATYGYAGDFSSDDDEKVEQVQVPTKYEDTSKPARSQIDEAIERIRRLPYNEEIDLPNDVLVGILDLYGTKHGPVVPSTKRLYNKICVRLVKDEMIKEPVVGLGDELNGNNNNNNLAKSASQQSAADTFSDDDDVQITASLTKNDAKRFDSRVVYNNNNVADDDDQMEVDSELNLPNVLQARQLPVIETDDDDDDDDDEDDDSSTTSDDDLSETGDDVNSESDALEVTPIKPPPSARREKEAIEVLMAMRPSTPKQTESTNLKRQPLAHSTPKEATNDAAKKPYTRSQRVTRSAAKGGGDMLKVDSKDKSSSSADVFVERKQTSRSKCTLVVVSLLVIVLGFLTYQFRSSILNTAEPLFRKKVTF